MLATRTLVHRLWGITQWTQAWRTFVRSHSMGASSAGVVISGDNLVPTPLWLVSPSECGSEESVLKGA